MHIRLSVEHLEDLLADVERSIRVNMDFVNRDEYCEASGYARGGLIAMRQRLEKLKQYNTHLDLGWWSRMPEFPDLRLTSVWITAYLL